MRDILIYNDLQRIKTYLSSTHYLHTKETEEKSIYLCNRKRNECSTRINNYYYVS